ncbi:hypothetical protein AB0N09_28180 [Streptomyces erythrochromogenes]|uniref:hypothetical protein n=1 Tax=Streptomyces erythrochromogenes TaxID=285574 RepID=UPI003430AEBE
MTHPLLPGSRVTHIGQHWATGSTTPEGTAEVLEVGGPYPDSSYEYRVRATRDFSRRPGPDNPMDREVWWSSRAVRPACPR